MSAQLHVGKKLFLVGFGVAVGLLLSWGLWQVVVTLQPPPRKIVAADHVALKRQLDDNPKALFQFDEDISYRMKSNFTGIRYATQDTPHVTNSRGFLGTVEINPDPAVRKILFLGDSVTYGNGLPREAAFVSLMQEKAGSQFQLFNAGCPGWSTYQQIGFYNKYVKDVDWDLVVFMVCLNDILKFEWVYKQGAGYEMAGEIELSGEIALRGARTLEEIRLGALRAKFSTDEKTRPLSRHHNGFLTNWEDTRWPAYFEFLEPLFSDRSRHPVMFAVLPTPYQIDAQVLGAPDEVVYFPQAKIHEYCQQHDVPTWDGAPPLAAAPDPRGARLFLDGCHLSAAGHEIVAEHLWQYVRTLLDEVAGEILARKDGAARQR